MATPGTTLGRIRRSSFRVLAGTVEILVIPLNSAVQSADLTLGGDLDRRSSDRSGGERSQNADARASWNTQYFLAGPENASICNLANRFLPQLLDQLQSVDRWNPLLLMGPSGCGKTHLVQGIVARWLEQSGSDSVCLMNAVDFGRELGSAVELNQVSGFRARFTRYRLFVFEDLQHLHRNESTQLELQHILDRMVEHGCQCIVTSNRCLPQLSWLNTTLFSRLMGGTSVTVRRISRGTRISLLRDLLAARGLLATEPQIEELANCAGKTLPHLRGTVAELEVLVRHLGTTDLGDILSAWTDRSQNRTPTMEEIIQVHAEHFQLTVNQLRSACRARSIVLARSLAMLLSRELTGASYTKIGAAFGGRDHSTVLHACHKIKRQSTADSTEKAAYELLHSKLTSVVKDNSKPRTKRNRRSA